LLGAPPSGDDPPAHDIAEKLNRIPKEMEGLKAELLAEYKRSEELKRTNGDLEREAYIRGLVASDKDHKMSELAAMLESLQQANGKLSRDLEAQCNLKKITEQDLVRKTQEFQEANKLLGEAEQILDDVEKVGAKLATMREAANKKSAPAA
jgi:hypothetical protein